MQIRVPSEPLAPVRMHGAGQVERAVAIAELHAIFLIAAVRVIRVSDGGDNPKIVGGGVDRQSQVLGVGAAAAGAARDAGSRVGEIVDSSLREVGRQMRGKWVADLERVGKKSYGEIFAFIFFTSRAIIFFP